MSVIDFLGELLQFLTAATACTTAVLAARRRNRDSSAQKHSVDKEDGCPSPDPSEEEAQKSSEERDRGPSAEEGNRKTFPEEV